MHYIATAMQNYSINKELIERGKGKGKGGLCIITLQAMSIAQQGQPFQDH
jgi:hypothetical protein